jgi:hypothetical protein
MARRGYRTEVLEFSKTEVTIRSSARIMDALEAMTKEMSLYQGVKFAQVLEAVYVQGKKDGAREVFERMDSSLKDAKKEIKHRPPGRPQKT